MERRGRVEIFRFDSKVLRDNPLGDASDRDVGVWLPPSYDGTRRFPTVMVLAGYAGVGLQHLNRGNWVEPLDLRLERLVRERRIAECVVVLPDCFTRYGGSQFVDSPAVGRWQTYLVEEVWPEVERRYRCVEAREGRAVVGKSSGGYGALEMAFDRPDHLAAVGAHAADSVFELCYLHELGKTVIAIEKKGGVKPWLAWFDQQLAKPFHATMVMANLLCAAVWSPRETGPYGWGEGFDFPLDWKTGALLEPVWRRWLERDPVRKVDSRLAAMRQMQAVFLDAGVNDEHNLQLGMRQLAAKLAAAGIAHVHEEFDGGHAGTPWRYERSFEVLTAALATG